MHGILCVSTDEVGNERKESGKRREVMKQSYYSQFSRKFKYGLSGTLTLFIGLAWTCRLGPASVNFTVSKVQLSSIFV